jgi:hypothetical protein
MASHWLPKTYIHHSYTVCNLVHRTESTCEEPSRSPTTHPRNHSPPGFRGKGSRSALLTCVLSNNTLAKGLLRQGYGITFEKIREKIRSRHLTNIACLFISLRMTKLFHHDESFTRGETHLVTSARHAFHVAFFPRPSV